MNYKIKSKHNKVMLSSFGAKFGTALGTLSGSWIGGQIQSSELQVFRTDNISKVEEFQSLATHSLIGSAIGGGIGLTLGATIPIWGPPLLIFQLNKHEDPQTVHWILSC